MDPSGDSASHALRWHAQGEHHVPAGREWLSPREAQRAAGMRFAKRRNDFLVSRWTAKQALAMALHPDAAEPDRVEVLPALTGAPLAYVGGRPAPCSVSLTDRAGWAVCLVGPAGRLVGCDLELVEERSAEFVADWFTPAEQALVAEVAASGAGRDLVANLVWSAKESALKVLQTGLRRDTRTVEVALNHGRVGAADGEWRPLSVRAVEGAVFPGWWCRHGEFVLTVAADTPTAAPVALSSPSPLREAVPSHTWFDDLRR